MWPLNGPKYLNPSASNSIPGVTIAFMPLSSRPATFLMQFTDGVRFAGKVPDIGLELIVDARNGKTAEIIRD